MIPIFQTFSQALVDYWKLQIADQSDQVAVLDIHKDLTRTTLDIICKCAFDYDCQALEDSNNKISAAFARVLGGLSLKYAFLPSLFLIIFSPHKRRDKIFTSINNFVFPISITNNTTLL